MHTRARAAHRVYHRFKNDIGESKADEMRKQKELQQRLEQERVRMSVREQDAEKRLEQQKAQLRQREEEERKRLEVEEKKLKDELDKKRSELSEKRRERLETLGHSDAPRLQTLRKPKASGRRAPTPGNARLGASIDTTMDAPGRNDAGAAGAAPPASLTSAASQPALPNRRNTVTKPPATIIRPGAGQAAQMAGIAQAALAAGSLKRGGGVARAGGAAGGASAARGGAAAATGAPGAGGRGGGGAGRGGAAAGGSSAESFAKPAGAGSAEPFAAKSATTVTVATSSNAAVDANEAAIKAELAKVEAARRSEVR